MIARSVVLVAVGAFLIPGCGSAAAAPPATIQASTSAPATATAATPAPTAAPLSPLTAWCAIPLGAPKLAVEAAMSGAMRTHAYDSLFSGVDFGAWTTSNTILFATYSNGKATKLQRYAAPSITTPSTELSCRAVRP